MADKFIISGFADEISTNVDLQFDTLNKLGIKYFEPRSIDGKGIDKLSDEEVSVLKEKMNKAGIKASSIGSPIGKISIKDEFAPHLELLKRVIDIAKEIDAEYIRMFSFFIPKEDDAQNWRSEVMNRMEQMVSLAEKEKIVLLHENERGIYGDTPERCLDIFKTVPSEYLKAAYDPANFVDCKCISYPDAYNMLEDKIEYFHIKDSIMDGEVVPAGLGDGGIDKILKSIPQKETPYFLSLEPHLGNYSGFKNLGEKGTSHSHYGGPEVFGYAFDALKKILCEINADFE